MEKILIIEDDLGISNSLKLYLENSNFEVGLHHSGENAIGKIKEYGPNLIILDINLPGKDGMEICKELRTFSKIAVIMLTARDSEYDRISGLEIGADDYIAKPFSPRELLVRIKTILKRTTKKELGNTLKFKNIELNLDKKITLLDGKKISLTNNEYDLLENLIKENGNVISREDLMTKVLGYEKYLYDRTLDTHIKNLRKKITTDQEIITTVRGKGYRLNK